MPWPQTCPPWITTEKRYRNGSTNSSYARRVWFGLKRPLGSMNLKSLVWWHGTSSSRQERQHNKLYSNIHGTQERYCWVTTKIKIKLTYNSIKSWYTIMNNGSWGMLWKLTDKLICILIALSYGGISQIKIIDKKYLVREREEKEIK